MVAIAPIEKFLSLLQTSMQTGGCRKLVLSRPLPAAGDLLRVDGRLVAVRGETLLSLTYHHQSRDLVQNLPLAQAIAEVRRLLGQQFADGHLHHEDGSAQLRFDRNGTAHCSTRRQPTAKPAPSLQHDRERTRWLDPTRPFLRELGVTTATGEIVPAMARKWRQIDKFVEIFAGALASIVTPADRPLEIVDFGAGKGYLTFAMHDWLRQRAMPARVTGVDQKLDLVEAGNARAARLQLDGLAFCAGDVADPPALRADVMIALHACDTATDHALHYGIRQQAAVILCAPCCHRELRPQLQVPAPLQPLLRHGIHAEREAEMLTDSLRALLLELHGYRVQVFEFVAIEHTQKNKMILGVRLPDRQQPAAQPQLQQQLQQQLDGLLQFYGLGEPCLLRLLRAPSGP